MPASDFCAAAQAVSDYDAQSEAPDLTGEGTFEELYPAMVAQLENGLPLVQALLDTAPAEIRPRVELLDANIRSITETIKASTTMDEMMGALFSQLDNQEFIQASEDVNAFINEQCGIEMAGSEL